MRNLKKALALVLALMMTLSLMVTVSASDYTDDNVIEQDEAVSVMSSLGIFNGMGDGSFDPAGSLTRAQAAKIITYMLLGQEVADSLPNTGSKFVDCPDGQWFVGPVNYLTDAGIVAGRDATTFDPNGKVSGHEFAKMLLGALGYDSKTEKFESDSSWAVNVAVKARQAGLDKDMTTSTVTSAALTREQACKLAFNTLTCDMVVYQGGMDITSADGTSIKVGGTAVSMANNTGSGYKASSNDSSMQFCELYFQTLKFDSSFSGSDDFGRALAKQWKISDDVAYTGAAKADVVITENVDADGLAKLLPKNAGTVSAGATLIENGTTAGGKLSGLAAVAGKTADGKLVEIYLNDDGDVETVVTVAYTVRTVESITEKNGKTTYKFSGGVSGVNDEDNTKVVLDGTIAKGDTVTTAPAKDGKIYVYTTTKFTGNQTAKKGTATSVKGTTVTIGGVQYTTGVGVSGVTDASFTNSKTEGNYWVDVNGYLVKVADIETTQEINYAVITKVIYGASATPTLDNPNPGQTVNVRAVLDDGSVLDVTLKTKVAAASDAKTNGTDGWTGDTIAAGNTICGNVKLAEGAINDSAASALEGKLYGYYMDDGKMVLDKVDFAANPGKDDVFGLEMADNYAGATSTTGKTNTDVKAVFNSKTVFIVYKIDEDNKVTAEVRTGVSSLKISDADGGLAIVTGTASKLGTASVVFLKDATAVVSDVDYVYISKASAENVLRDDKNVWKYTGITPDGEEIDVYTENNTALSSANGLYAYDPETMVIGALKVGVATATAAHDAQFNHVIKAQTSEELILVNDTWVPTTDDTKVVYVNELDGIAGNNCLIEVKDGKIVTIYVYACQHAGSKTWEKATEADEDGAYAIGDHIQTCGQCGAVIDSHAKPVCAGGADHSSGEGQPVSCGVEGCTVSEPNCTVNHTAS